MDYVVQTRQQLWGDFEQKWAEATGTSVMPHGVNNVTPEKSKTVIQKTASVDPRVDVHGKEPDVQHIRKVAQHYAMPKVQRYPLDSFSDVEKAAAYFGEWRGHFSPAERHEYCENLVKRASALGCPVTEEISKYGSSSFAPTSELQVAIDGRRNVVPEHYASLLDKLAAMRIEMTPEYFATALDTFDKVACIDHLYDSDIMDPYYSTYGVKVAEQDCDDTIVVGNDFMTVASLRSLGKRAQIEFDNIFSLDFIKEFRDDPVGIFESLPIDQKKVIMRIAASSGSNA